MRSSAAALAVLLVSLASGCRAKSAAPKPQRLALLPFDNQSGDPRFDWLSRALPTALSEQFVGAANLRAAVVRSAGEAAALRADLLLTGYLARDAGGVTLNWVLENYPKHTVERSAQIQTVTDATLLRNVHEMALAITPSAAKIGTASLAALQARAAGEHERAVTLDPSYGEAWVDWATSLATEGDPSAALTVITRARSSRPTPLNSARLKALEARLTQNRALLAEAAGEVADLSGDTPALVEAAQAALAARNFARAATYYRKALDLDPSQEAWWNSLSYIQAYQGDFAAARRSNQEYRRLSSNSANSIDSHAEIQFIAGQFDESAKLFRETFQKDKSFLGGVAVRKAAVAQLLAGKFNDAELLSSAYLKDRDEANDALVEINRAMWEYRSSRASAALNRLAGLQEKGPKPVAALASLQLALLSLDAGDREGAKRHATRARELGLSPQAAALAITVLFVTLPDVPAAEWGRRAEDTFRAPALAGVRYQAAGLALLYRKRFADAVPFLKKAYEFSDPSDDAFPRETYAWALLESGQNAEAAALLKWWSPPSSEDTNLLAPLIDTRGLFLRARIAESAGRSGEARSLYETFVRCFGNRSDFFGHLDKARSAVTL